MLNGHITSRKSWPLIAGNPVPYLNSLRDAASAVAHDNKVTRPPGKYAFGDFVRQNGGRAPESVALIREGRATSDTPGAGQSIQGFLKALPAGRYFCKPDKGTNGYGAFRLDAAAAAILVDGAPQSPDEIAQRLSADTYLVQKSLTDLQHPDIACFNAGTINTLRLVTFDAQGGPKPVFAFLRLACASAAVDNWSAGGVAVPVDLERGVLQAQGVIKKDLELIDAHPLTGVKFAGRRIPWLCEAVEMASLLQRKLDTASLGWDIALLKDGPAVIEANRRWGVYLSAQLNPGFISEFLAFHLLPGTDTIRLELTGNFMPRSGVRMWLSQLIGACRASARVVHHSDERLAMIVRGPRVAIDAVMHQIGQSASRHNFKSVYTLPASETVQPGLDVGATFAS